MLREAINRNYFYNSVLTLLDSNNNQVPTIYAVGTL